MQKRVRAILIDKGMIVLIKRVKKHETYYVFPGGGVEDGENLEEALKREIKEELDVEIFIGKLFLEKQFGKGGLKQNEYFYLCKIAGGILGTGNGPEYKKGNQYEGTHEVMQIPAIEMKKLNVLPSEVRDTVLEYLKNL